LTLSESRPIGQKTTDLDDLGGIIGGEGKLSEHEHSIFLTRGLPSLLANMKRKKSLKPSSPGGKKKEWLVVVSRGTRAKCCW